MHHPIGWLIVESNLKKEQLVFVMFPPGHKWAENADSNECVIFENIECGTSWMFGNEFWYLGAWPDCVLWDRIIAMGCAKMGIEGHDLPDGLRLRQAGTRLFTINYSSADVTWRGATISACGVAAWDGKTRIL